MVIKMQKAAKHDLMRTTNALSILETIVNHGPLTKREIQDNTGISWGAVSNIITDLHAKKIIEESKCQETGIGRTPSKYDISSSNNLFIGVDVNIEGLAAVLIDLKCRVLKSIRTNVVRNDPENILNQIKTLVRTLISENKLSSKKIIGIGVAMQGAVDAENGISIFSPHFENWKNVPLKDILEKEFGIDTYIEHDPNCMALSERWFGMAKGIKNLLFIRLSMGIGMSIIINGEIYRGADGSAGEFGHIIMNPSGPRCYCGNYGCLEVYSSGQSILNRTEEGIKLGRTNISEGNNGELDFKSAVNAARQGDGYILSLFGEAATYLGVGISNLINIFNPDAIVLGGELSSYHDLFFEKVKEIVKQKAWKGSRTNLVTSKLGSDSAAIGAATLFIQKIFSGEINKIML